MERHFYFFRHGQTNENKAGKREGTGIDAWLTKLGIIQAQQLSEFLKNKKIQVIYSSPYKRAIDTAEIVLKNYHNVDIITAESLKEAVFGFWYDENEIGKNTINDNFNRIKKYLEHIVESDNRKNIAIASHGGVTRALCFACGHKVYGIQNCECFHFILNKDSWKYIESFKPQLDTNK